MFGRVWALLVALAVCVAGFAVTVVAGAPAHAAIEELTFRAEGTVEYVDGVDSISVGDPFVITYTFTLPASDDWDPVGYAIYNNVTSATIEIGSASATASAGAGAIYVTDNVLSGTGELRDQYEVGFSPVSGPDIGGMAWRQAGLHLQDLDSDGSTVPNEGLATQPPNLSGFPTRFLSANFDDISCESPFPWECDGGLVQATVDSIVAEVDAGGLGWLGGVVTDNNGDPAPNIVVNAVGPTTETTSTLLDGSYLFSGLVPGQYTVEFVDPSGTHLTEWYEDQTDSGSATPVTVTPDWFLATDAVLLRSDAAGCLYGYAYGAAFGQRDTDVFLQSDDDSFYQQTDREGFFSFCELPPDTYRILFVHPSGMYLPTWYGGGTDYASAGTIILGPGETAFADYTEMTSAGLGVLYGYVTNESSAPLANVVVNIVGPNSATVTTTSDGYYEYFGLTPGDYTVQFVDPSGTYASEWYDDQPDLGSATTVTVPVDDYATANAVLAANDADADDDGVVDTVDTDGGTGTSPAGSFDDHDGTTGQLTDNGGVAVTISDAPAPDGVLVVTGPGPGPAVFDVCGEVVNVAANSEAELTCGSVILGVISGSATVVLGDGITVVSVPVGVTVEVESTGDGGYTVDVLPGSTDVVTITVDGVTTTVDADDDPVTVRTWDFVGFAAPVDNAPTVNVIQGGKTVPLKWRLLHADHTPVVDLTSVTISFATTDCVTGAVLAVTSQATTGSSGLQNQGKGNYHLNWKAPKASGCGTLHLDLGEGITRTADFRVK